MRSFLLIICFTFVLPLHAQRSDFDDIDFWRAEYIANEHKGEDLYNLPGLVHGLTSQLKTDAERFRAIYYWVCHNIKGEYNLMNDNNRNHKKLQDDPKALDRWNRAFKKEVFAKLLKDKETLCTGYAYLIKEMANLAGLECEIVYGFDLTQRLKVNDQDTPDHTWNAIKLDGKWYLCDATWSSGLIDMSTLLFEFNYDNKFFLMEPSEFAKTHKPVDSRWLLLSQDALLSRLGSR